MGNPDLRCISISPRRVNFAALEALVLLTLLFFLFDIVKRRPKLKGRHKERIETAIGYSEMIDNWDDLVDPRTLAFYNLGPDPSAYVLRQVGIEGKKSKYYPRQC